jgi:hypothetical protein
MLRGDLQDGREAGEEGTVEETHCSIHAMSTGRERNMNFGIYPTAQVLRPGRWDSDVRNKVGKILNVGTVPRGSDDYPRLRRRRNIPGCRG